MRRLERSISLGRVFGIPLSLHYTWFLIFALVAASVLSVLPAGYALWARVAMALVASLLFFASLLAHEMSHSLVARKKGIPVRGITLFVFGGVARIAREAARPGQEMAVAVVGPASSLALAVLFFGLFLLVGRYDSGIHALFFPGGTPGGLLMTILGWLAAVNLALATFNLAPGLPLDGGRMLRAAIWRIRGDYRTATRIASWSGRAIAVLIIAGGAALALLAGDVVGGVWLVLVGWFLNSTAAASQRHTTLREHLAGLRTADVMAVGPAPVPEQLTLAQLVHSYVLPSGGSLFAVAEGAAFAGMLAMENIKSVPRSRWDTTTVGQAMTPAARLRAAAPGQSAASVLDLMDEEEVDYVPVVQEGRLLGIVSRAALAQLIRTRNELARG